MSVMLRHVFTGLVMLAILVAMAIVFSAHYIPSLKIPYRHVISAVPWPGHHGNATVHLFRGGPHGGGWEVKAPPCYHARLNQYKAISLCTGRPLPHMQNSTLLVLFTSVQDLAEKRFIHLNTVHLWSLLALRLHPVLFLTASVQGGEVVDKACAAGWDVLPTPRCNKWGLPSLKAMFAVVTRYYNISMFYGYANGDLLFDVGLLDTLSFLETSRAINNSFLVVGRRTDVQMRVNQSVTLLSEVLPLSLTGKLAWVNTIDFFITPQSGFPWNLVRDVVVGRRAYDNYLLWWAGARGIPVIDITQTCVALHQSGQHGYYASHSAPGADYNVRVIGNYDYYRGTTSCAPFVTLRGQDGVLHFAHRVAKIFCGKNNWKDGHQEKLKILL